MSNDSLLALCAIAGIVGILILLAAVLLVTVLRGSIFGLANLVLRSVVDPKEESSVLDGRIQAGNSRWRSRDLRQQAQSVDFDQAVARQRGEGTPAIRTTSTTPIPNTLGKVDTLPPDDEPTERVRRRRTENEDGLLDGFIDPDNVDDGLFGG
jgi:hypothetical protein